MDDTRPDDGWRTVACTYRPVQGVDTSALHEQVRGVVEGLVGRQPGSTAYCVPGRILPPPAP